jgi:hypothetical protein
LNRSEAVSVYKEIVKLIETVGYNNISLEFSEKNDPLAQNYQLHIKIPQDRYINGQIESVAEKHQLKVLQMNGKIVVYQPKKIVDLK